MLISPQLFQELLKHSHINVNVLNASGEAPIHAIVRHKSSKRLDLLSTLLIHSNADVNLVATDGNTALHLAVMV